MQHDNHKIDKQLRQLETQALPDLSGMDDHWQQMKTQIKPVGKSPKRYYYLIAACVAGILILVSYFVIIRKKPDAVVTEYIKPVITEKLTGDTVPSANTKTVDSIHVVTTPPVFLRITPDDPSQPYYTVPFIRIGPGAVSGSMADSSQDNNNPKATLEQFFSQLEKPSQEFVINPLKDTVVMGQDGTGLLIPAGTFAKEGAVTLILKEFYSYEDIITNRLSTWSSGEQLITGGMVHISALRNGKEINIEPGKNIRWFVPDTTADMSQMQLFTGQPLQTPKSISDPPIEEGESFFDKLNYDTVAQGRFSGMNWIPQNQKFSNNFLITSVKVFYLRDAPFKVAYGKKTKAKFYRNTNSHLSKKELKVLLAEKYPKYDKIIVRDGSSLTQFQVESVNLLLRKEFLTAVSLGDSIWIPAQEARTYRIPASDTITYWNNASSVNNNFFKNESLRELSARYSVNISSLGWVNCDRFYKDNRPKVNFVVNMKDSSSNYSTFLVFDKIKSMMSGSLAGDKVVFFNVPLGETARVVSVGVQESKPVASVQNVVISRTTYEGLQFEPTTPSEFKQEVAVLDK